MNEMNKKTKLVNWSKKFINQIRIELQNINELSSLLEIINPLEIDILWIKSEKNLFQLLSLSKNFSEKDLNVKIYGPYDISLDYESILKYFDIIKTKKSIFLNQNHGDCIKNMCIQKYFPVINNFSWGNLYPQRCNNGDIFFMAFIEFYEFEINFEIGSILEDLLFENHDPFEYHLSVEEIECIAVKIHPSIEIKDLKENEIIRDIYKDRKLIIGKHGTIYIQCQDLAEGSNILNFLVSSFLIDGLLFDKITLSDLDNVDFCISNGTIDNLNHHRKTIIPSMNFLKPFLKSGKKDLISIINDIQKKKTTKNRKIPKISKSIIYSSLKFAKALSNYPKLRRYWYLFYETAILFKHELYEAVFIISWNIFEQIIDDLFDLSCEKISSNRNSKSTYLKLIFLYNNEHINLNHYERANKIRIIRNEIVHKSKIIDAKSALSGSHLIAEFLIDKFDELNILPEEKSFYYSD